MCIKWLSEQKYCTCIMCSLVPRPCTFVTWISRRILYCNANFILQATNSKAWERGYIMWPWLTNILWLQVCPSVSHTQSKQREREREREREKKKTKKKKRKREKKKMDDSVHDAAWWALGTMYAIVTWLCCDWATNTAYFWRLKWSSKEAFLEVCVHKWGLLYCLKNVVNNSTI